MSGKGTTNPYVHLFRAPFTIGPLASVAATILGAIYLSPWLILPGMIAWGFTWYMAGPGRMQRELQAIREADRMMRELPPQLRPIAVGMQQTIVRVRDTIAEAEPGARVMLAGLEVEVEQLGQAANLLMASARRLYRYLQANSPARLHDTAVALRARIEATEDDFARRQLQEAAAGVAAQQQAYQEIERLLGRVEASLRNIQASLDSLYPQIVKLGAGDLSEEAHMQHQTFERLAEVRGTVAALQDVIDTKLTEV